MAKTTKKAVQATAESVLDAAIDVLHLGIESISEEIQKIRAGKAKKSKFDDASRIAHLAKQAGTIADSVRKAESARNKRLDALTMAMVLEWARALPASEQAVLRRELDHATAKRSGLA